MLKSSLKRRTRWKRLNVKVLMLEKACPVVQILVFSKCDSDLSLWKWLTDDVKLQKYNEKGWFWVFRTYQIRQTFVHATRLFIRKTYLMPTSFALFLISVMGESKGCSDSFVVTVSTQQGLKTVVCFSGVPLFITDYKTEPYLIL